MYENLEKLNPQKAIELLRKAVAANPKHIRSKEGLAQMIEELGCDFNEAQALYREVITMDPFRVKSTCYLAKLLKNKGEKEGAEKLVRQAYQINAKDVVVQEYAKSFGLLQ